MLNILVTSGSSRVAYSICKTLAKQGYRIYIGDKDRFPMAASSRYCAGSMVYTPHFDDEERFLVDIENFIQEKKIDILVPVLDETFTVAKHIERFRNKVKFFLPNHDKIATIHNKKDISLIAEEVGVAVPEIWDTADVLSGALDCAGLPFPVLIKPKRGGGGWGIRKFNSAPELLKAIKEAKKPQDFMIQRFIDGKLVGVCGIYKDGQLLASDVYSFATVYPLQVGQSTRRESIQAEGAQASFKKLLDHLAWNGVCEIDFIVEHSSQKSYLLDANPRFWGAVGHNIAAGMDYPYYYCQLALGTNNAAFGSPVLGTKTRWLGGDLMRHLAEFKIAESKWGYLKQVLQSKTDFAASDDWSITDPLPFMTWAGKLVCGKFFKRVR